MIWRTNWVLLLCCGLLMLFPPVEDGEIYVIEEPPRPNLTFTFIGAIISVILLIVLDWLGFPILFFLDDRSEKKDEEEKGGD